MMRRSSAESRPGYVLFAVLIVVVVLSLAGYRYSEAMTSEYQMSVRVSEAVEAKAFAYSGVHYAMGMLSDPETLNGTLGGNPYDNPAFFAGMPVGDSTLPRGGGRFTLMNFSDSGGTGDTRYAPRYGVADESAKLNINALILLDPTGEVLYNALLKLDPVNMTPEIADAIVDWVDSDDTQRPAGAESTHYLGLANPYKCKNGPLNSIEELLLVRGVTPQLLFGTDRNRNGVQDADEAAAGDFSRGWSEWLTCYGRELDVDSQGYPRINLNMMDLAALSQQLTEKLGQEVSDYIVYQRATNKARTAAPLTANQIAANPSTMRSLVQALLDSGSAIGIRKLNSVLSIYNTQMSMPATGGGGGGPGPPRTPITPIVAGPLNDPDTLNRLLPILLDSCTTTDTFELTPRINVCTAPLEVLSTLPGLTPGDVDAILAARAGLVPGDPETVSAAWLVTKASLTPAKFRAVQRYISGRSQVYRVNSVGYFGKPGGAVARVEAVVDTTQVAPGQVYPRIVYYRDVTELGRAFTDLPR